MADNLEEIYCPACGKKMEKIFMSAQGVNLDVCTQGCGGIFFDNREFKKFDENAEDISPLTNALKDKEFIKVDSTEKRFCANCGAPMVKNFASAKKEIEIDECYTCGSKFLDYQELDKIRAQYETETDRADDAVRQYYTDNKEAINAFDEKYMKQMGSQSLLSRIIQSKY